MKFAIALLFCCWAAAAQAVVEYSTILPGFGGPETSVTAMATDKIGNTYLTGVTANSAFPASEGVVQPKFGGGVCTYGGSPLEPPQYFNCTDAFVAKLDSRGKVVFATFLGGSGQDRATSIGVDGSGNIYVAGICGSGDFPRVLGPVFDAAGPTFIIKLNPSGTTLLYSALLPGTGPLPFLAPFQPNVPVSSVNMVMAVDPEGNAYFAANASTGFPITEGALQSSGSMVAGKLDPTGTRILYGTYLGGTGFDSVSAIAVDSQGSVYLDGSTNSVDFPITPGALQTTLPEGASAAFVTKLNAPGTALLYSTYLGGGSYAHPSQLRVNRTGEVYVLGTLQGAGFPVTAGAFETNWTAGSAFLSKLNENGTALLYSTFFTVSGTPASSLDIDADGNAYVAGQTGPGFPAPSGAIPSAYAGGGDDVLIAGFTPGGSLDFTTYLGGVSYETAYAIASLNNGTVVVSGATDSSDFPSTSGTGPGLFVSKLLVSADQSERKVSSKHPSRVSATP